MWRNCKAHDDIIAEGRLDSAEDAAQDDRDHVRTGRRGMRERAARAAARPFHVRTEDGVDPPAGGSARAARSRAACRAARRPRRDAASEAPVVVPPPPPPDLVRLLSDTEARVRRRAALAVGRVGLRDGIEPLVALLRDPDPEVRYMAAFALGLIGDKGASGAAGDRAR